MLMWKYGIPFLLFIGFPIHTAAQANTEPRYFSVTGLIDGDVLNVRAKSTAKSEDIGDLTSADGPLEVWETDDSGKWGRILWEGDNAWVSLAYLSPTIPLRLRGTEIPIGMQCSGTEPFWNFKIDSQETVGFKTIGDENALSLEIKSVIQSQNTHQFSTALSVESSARTLTALFSTGQCSDGMSDKTYGWEVNILMKQSADQVLLSGCCQLPVNAR